MRFAVWRMEMSEIKTIDDLIAELNILRAHSYEEATWALQRNQLVVSDRMFGKYSAYFETHRIALELKQNMAQSESLWISVKERLPVGQAIEEGAEVWWEEGIEVWCLGKHNEIYQLYYVGNGKFQSCDADDMTHYVKYWYPIPPYPLEKNDG